MDWAIESSSWDGSELGIIYLLGYLEVGVTLPGLNQNAEGYVSVFFFGIGIFFYHLV